MSDGLDLKIKEMLAQMTGLDVTDINDGDNLFEDLGIDSLKAIEVATTLERNFGVVVKDSQLMNLKTVSDAVNFVRDFTKDK